MPWRNICTKKSRQSLQKHNLCAVLALFQCTLSSLAYETYP